MIKLSICIPTYNRVNKLLLLLESIEKQIKNSFEAEVEIVISDNASSDTTENKVLEFIEKNKHIKINYNKNIKNMGIDFNIRNVIEKSQGEYVWLLGDDELLKEKAIEKLLKNFKLEKDVYILNGEDMEDLNALKSDDLKVYDTKNISALVDYIDDINDSLRFFFCLISSLVFKREKFLVIEVPMKLRNSSYDHLFIFLKMAKNGISICYLKNCYYILGKEENEWNKKRGKHFLLDIETLYKFLTYLFSKKEQELLKIRVKKLLQIQHQTLRDYLYLFEYSNKVNKEEEVRLYLNYFELYSRKVRTIEKIEKTKIINNVINIAKFILK